MDRSADVRTAAAAIFQAAIRAVDPVALVTNYVSAHASADVLRGPLLVIGAGKAAARMAAGCEQALGLAALHGEVVVADGCGAPLRSIRFSEAGHPLPDSRGERATHRIVERLEAHEGGDILCLISGGASSLLVYPRAPVTLADEIATTRLLLECGADIRAINTVRKHLSEVKGGGLLRRARARMTGLLISDVVGDDPGTIGSGPTASDETTFADAWGVFTRYGLTRRVPASVAELMQRGMAGQIPETVKPGTAEATRCRNVIIGSNRTALEGAANAARELGWAVEIETDSLSGDTTAAAHAFAGRLRQRLATGSVHKGICILAGGETTVRVTGSGRGGRNQEFALALTSALAGTPITVLSAGTDGIDGPTDVAGAFLDGTTLRRAQSAGLNPDAALRANDSHTFFSRLGDLFRCGPTGTNVMDIKIALIHPQAAAAGS